MKNLFLPLFILSHIITFSQDLIPYRLDNKWGYADNSGNIIIEPTYDKVRWFGDDDYACVYQDNLCAVIDKKGNLIIPFKYTEIFNFSDGLAAACKGGEYYWLQGEIVNGEWGFINLKGEEVIPFNYYRVESFVDGYAIVQNDNNWGMWGVIDKNGKQILPFKYKTYSFDMRPFPGLKWDENEKGKLLYRPGQDDEVWRQIDLKGKLTGKKIDDIHGFSNSGELNYTESKNGKYALLDSKHKPLTDYIYSRGIYFYEFYTFTKISIDTDIKDSTDKFIQAYGVIDNKGEIILPCVYKSIDINNGYITLENQEGKYALADSTGKIIIPWKKENIEYIGEGIYKLKVSENSIDLYQLNGEKLNTFNISQCKYKFTDGLLGVTNENNKWGFINKKGEVIIDFKYDYVNLFKNGYAEVDMNKGQYKVPDDGLINTKGVEFFRNTPGLFTKYKNGNTYIVDEYERVIIENLTYAKKLDDGKIIYKNNNNLYQVIDSDGRKYLKRELVDLFQFSVNNNDPDLPGEDYFIGTTKDSSYIYNSSLQENFGFKKDIDFRSFELLKNNGVLILTEKEGSYLVNLMGRPITKKYNSLQYITNNNLIATLKDGSKGYINSSDEIIIPFSKGNLFVDNENIIISSTFSGKKLINVDFYDFQGKKLNNIKITHYRKETSLPGFYVIESSSSKKIGYLFNDKTSDFIYDYIEVKTYYNNKYIILKKDNQYSIYNPNLEKIKGPYDELILESNFITFKENNAYGLLSFENSELIEILPAKYESIPRFNYQRKAEIFAVKTNGKYIFINSKGEKVIDKEFDDANQLSYEFTWVKYNGKVGYIHKDGSWVIEPKYDYLEVESNSNYSGPTFYGRLDGKTVFLNELGENKLSADVDSINLEYLESNYHFIALNKDNKMGLYDFDGNQITPMKYDDILTYYTETKDGELTFYQAKMGKKYAFLNQLGKEITDFSYDKIEYDDDSYITGWIGVLEVKQNGKYGLIDFNGKQIQPCEFDYFDWYFEFSEEFQIYPAKRNGKFGLIGKNGQLLIDTKYDKIFIDEEILEYFRSINNNLHFTVILNKKKGVVDINGNQIINCNYSNLYFSYDCQKPSLEILNGKKHGLFTDNKVLFEPQFDYIYCEYGESGQYYVVMNKKKYQIFDANGQQIGQSMYDSYEWDGVGYLAIVQHDKKYFYLNADGSETAVED